MARNPAQIANYKQFWTLYHASVPADGQWPEFNQKHGLLSANTASCFQAGDAKRGAVQWWQVVIHAAEVARETFTAPEALALRPLPSQEILNLAEQPVTTGGVPAGSVIRGTAQNAARYSQLKARVTFSDGTAIQRVVELDIGGGTTISFCSQHVEVEVLTPAPVRVIDSGADLALVPTLGDVPGIVLDSWVQASASPAPCAPIGRRVARWSVTRQLTQNVPMLFEVPAGAVECTIYPQAAAAAGTTYQWMAGPSALASGNVGDVITIGGLPNTYNTMRVPGTARYMMITPPNIVGGNQILTVVFTLEY